MQGKSDPNRELLDAAALCGHLVPEGSVHAFLASHRASLFPDELFEDLFPSGRGRPSVPADVVATVMVLQALEGLSDRDAARELRTNIAWKVAAGLSLGDEGFHPTVLTLWRNKLRASQRPERIFDAVRAVVEATGAIRGKSRRVLDATVLDDAVTTQDAVMQLVAAIRRVRRVLPQARALSLDAHDYDNDPGKPACAWDDPDGRDALLSALVTDALAVLAAGKGLELDQAQAEALGLLALVAGQDVEPGEGEGTWRIIPRTTPGRMVSVVDPDSRHVHKSRSVYRDGYKAHIAVEPDTGLVTDCALTPGDVPDGDAGLGLLADEPDALEVLADSAYGSGEVRAALRAAGHRQAIKPIPLRTPIPSGFDRDDFVVDHDAGTVTCPAGHTLSLTARGNARFELHCRGCPLRDRCTTSARGKSIKIGRHDRELVEARRAWHAGEVADAYRRHRPMVERTIAWLVARGHRKVRYRGVERNQLWLATRVAAINLRRLVNLGLRLDASGWVLHRA
ncbi:MAG TPA: IS1182 family transposase [Acidimicrobiales bacterium]|nr:IS1182 family transposase [Acidimicrobiales bacterium]